MLNRPLTEEIELKLVLAISMSLIFTGFVVISLLRQVVRGTGKDGDKDNFWNVETANLLSDALTKDEEKDGMLF